MKAKKKRTQRAAYALSSTMALVFLLTVLLGVVVAHIEYSADIMGVYLKRVQARSELVSMTNLALKWLRTRFDAGTRPKANVVDETNKNENLTDFNSLSIFSSCNVQEDMEGRVQVFDLDYDPESVAEPLADPLLFPPSLPGGYMIRATVTRKGLAPLMAESVYVSACYDVPEAGEVHVLEKTPLYWRELLR